MACRWSKMEQQKQAREREQEEKENEAFLKIQCASQHSAATGLTLWRQIMQIVVPSGPTRPIRLKHRERPFVQSFVRWEEKKHLLVTWPALSRLAGKDCFSKRRAGQRAGIITRRFPHVSSRMSGRGRRRSFPGWRPTMLFIYDCRQTTNSLFCTAEWSVCVCVYVWVQCDTLSPFPRVVVLAMAGCALPRDTHAHRFCLCVCVCENALFLSCLISLVSRRAQERESVEHSIRSISLRIIICRNDAHAVVNGDWGFCVCV